MSRRLLTRRIVQVGAAQSQLIDQLEALVASTPWISKFGATASFGVGPSADPYVRMCRAECMLALIILHVEGGKVDFIEEERLEVLRDGTAPEGVKNIRAAAAEGA
jgi:hypothetical protein